MTVVTVTTSDSSFFYTDIRRKGNNLLIRGIRNDTGMPFLAMKKFQPYFFLDCKEGDEDARTIFNAPVKRIDFGTMYEAKDWLENYDNVSGMTVHGIKNYPVQYIAEKWPETVEYDYSKIKISVLDLEVECPNGFPHPEDAKEAIMLISMSDSITGKITVWSTKPIATDHGENVIIRSYSSEKEMLTEFLSDWNRHPPNILTGWNVRFFDVAYLINRLSNLGIDPSPLSPWNMVATKNISLGGPVQKFQQTFDIYGVAIMDYMELVQKYAPKGRSMESYKLDNIAKHYLKKGKAKKDCSFQDFYTKFWEEFVHYNIIDVQLVLDLDKKLDILRYLVDIAYFAKVPTYNDVYGPVKLWEIIISNWLRRHHNKVVTETKANLQKTEKYKGAYVKEPVIGLHKWVVNFDLNSLYPSIARQWNIGPETKVQKTDWDNTLRGVAAFATFDKLMDMSVDLSPLKEYHLSMTANKQFYRKGAKSFFSEIFGYLYNERVEVKKKMIEDSKKLEIIKKLKQDRGLTK